MTDEEDYMSTEPMSGEESASQLDLRGKTARKRKGAAHYGEEKSKVSRDGSDTEALDEVMLVRSRMEKEERMRMEEGAVRKLQKEERTKVQRQKQLAEEELVRKVAEENVVERRNSVGDGEDFEIGIGKIQVELGKIMEAISKENGGKISVTRMDQGIVKEAIYRVQNGVMEIMKKQLKMEREARRLEDENGILKENERLKRMSGERRAMERLAGRIMPEKDSSSEASVEPMQPRRRTRTYAEISVNQQALKEKGRSERVGMKGLKVGLRWWGRRDGRLHPRHVGEKGH
ncbi:hypothetical protein NQ314_002965 [Rhamnusium bicolor]|uniref:Uncharacterized protein n=1 Tax=Rhamnusium bicolor TaxID=1586634 RepID=A0AAV8ZQ08_9CUCU|nr:hypothetical protein NQ314_002965 [Rhamnusium bicolor]